MINIAFFIILILIIGGLSGVLYLIYIPLKKRLKRVGKLTDKISTRLNWLFILIPSFIVILLFCFKDYRTPSKKRLERIADIQLPNKFTVLKDEYQNMWQDYCIDYEIEFSNNSIGVVIENVKKSKFYIQHVYAENKCFEEKVNSTWRQIDNGYFFRAIENRTIYTIKLDTINNILKYRECAD